MLNRAVCAHVTEPSAKNAITSDARNLEHKRVVYAVNMDRHGSDVSSETVLRLPSKVDDVTNMEQSLRKERPQKKLQNGWRYWKKIKR